MSENEKKQGKVIDDNELARISGAGPSPSRHPVLNPDPGSLKQAAVDAAGSGGGGGGVSPELTDIPTGGGNFTPGQA